MPWLLIAAGAIILGLFSKKTNTPPTDSTSSQGNAPVSNGGLFVPLSAPSLLTQYTNRPTGRLVGGFTEKLPEGPSGGDKALALAKTIVGGLKTAVSLIANIASQAGVAVASSVSSAIPVVGAVIGIGTGAAGLAQGSKDEGLSEATSFVGALPGVGLVGLAVTIPRLFEGIADAQHLRREIRDAKHDQAKSASDLTFWSPKAAAVSAMLDEWYTLPRYSDVKGIATSINAACVDLLNAFPQTISVAIDHIRLGEHVGSEGVALVPGRDTTQLETLFSKAAIDCVILQMATADLLSRLKAPYRTSQYMTGDYVIAGTADFAGYPGPWTNTDRAGIIPGAVVTSIDPERRGFSSDQVVSVAPSLQAIRARMNPPRFLETFIAYYETADSVRFHASKIYQRIVQSRALLTLDTVSPLPSEGAPLPSAATVKAEIATNIASATKTGQAAVTFQTQQYLAVEEQAFTSGGM